MDRLPAGVRWGLMLMGAVVLSQVVDVRRIAPAPLTGIQAAPASAVMPAAAMPAQEAPVPSVSTRPGCARSQAAAASRAQGWDSLRHERDLVIASDQPAAEGGNPVNCTDARVRSAASRRSC